MRSPDELAPGIARLCVEFCRRLRDLLVKQVTGLVRWRESVLAMKEADVDTVVELGAGKVLSGLARRIDKDVNGISVGTPAELEAFLRSL